MPNYPASWTMKRCIMVCSTFHLHFHVLTSIQGKRKAREEDLRESKRHRFGTTVALSLPRLPLPPPSQSTSSVVVNAMTRNLAIKIAFDWLRESCVQCWAVGDVDSSDHNVDICVQLGAPGRSNFPYHEWRRSIKFLPRMCYNCGMDQKVRSLFAPYIITNILYLVDVRASDGTAVGRPR
jgi:hypothetical protein